MNKKNLFDKVTLLIVTFKSHNIIEKCLDNIDRRFKIILIENSADTNLTSYLEKKYLNLKSINIGYDSGFAYALNRGIELVKTDYLISLNPDSFPQKHCLETIIETADKYHNVDIITPITLIKNGSKEFDDYGYFKKREVKKNTSNHLYVSANLCLPFPSLTKYK